MVRLIIRMSHREDDSPHRIARLYVEKSRIHFFSDMMQTLMKEASTRPLEMHEALSTIKPPTFEGTCSTTQSDLAVLLGPHAAGLITAHYRDATLMYPSSVI